MISVSHVKLNLCPQNSLNGGNFKKLVKLRISVMKESSHLLDFVYHGQTTVCQDNVKAFLRLGEELGVTGLVEEVKEKTNE